MAWTLERYRATLPTWSGTATRQPQREDPMARFIDAVDRLYYAAAIAFAICVIALIVI